MADSAKAVFLSYASQDAEAARRICEALRSAGVEVWFDAEGGLEHGDEWDAKIRRQIEECVLFIAIISANTEAREEGYFRIEWELAAERAMGIATGVAFILPVVIDDTREADALVPDRFRKVQWTRLPGGEMRPEVRARLLKLWSHRTGALAGKPGSITGPPIFGESKMLVTRLSGVRDFASTFHRAVKPVNVVPVAKCPSRVIDQRLNLQADVVFNGDDGSTTCAKPTPSCGRTENQLRAPG